jgi:benzoyl-CoA reductase/2-hydroxyglutaryl-CoA dehydratase subunit BcrC/BadD/HgdB
VYAAYPAELFQMVFGNIFNKMVPLLKSAEQKWLKSGAVAHCGNVKTIVGLFASGLIPQPDLLITSDWLCDTSPKSIDLLSEVFKVPASSYNTCQDRMGHDYNETKRIIDLAVNSMRKTVSKMEKIVGYKINDDDLWSEIDIRNKLKENILKTQIVIEKADTVPISATHAILLHNIGKLTIDRINMPDLLEATDLFYHEIEKRVREGVGILERGAPRVMALLPPHFADPRLEHLVGEKGIALVAAEGRFFPPNGTHIPNIEKPTNPYQAMSIYLHSSILQSSNVRKNTILEACRELKLDGLLCVTHIGCRAAAGDSLIIRDSILKEVGIPGLFLEYESFDPRAYDEDKLIEKLEIFRSMIAKND